MDDRLVMFAISGRSSLKPLERHAGSWHLESVKSCLVTFHWLHRAAYFSSQSKKVAIATHVLQAEMLAASFSPAAVPQSLNAFTRMP